MRIDHRVSTEQPEEFSEHERGRDPDRPCIGGMREHRHLQVLGDQFLEHRDADEPRRHQRGADTLLAQDLRLRIERLRGSHQARRIQRGAPGFLRSAADRLLASGHALGKRRIALVGNTVVVLDDIDTGSGKHVADARELRDRQSLGLQRSAGQGTTVRSGEAAQAFDPEARPAAGFHQRLRQVGIQEFDMRVHRTVAEQHVECLRDIVAGRVDGQRDAGDKLTLTRLIDGQHPTDDAFAHGLVENRIQGDFDALFERDRRSSLLGKG